MLSNEARYALVTIIGETERLLTIAKRSGQNLCRADLKTCFTKQGRFSSGRALRRQLQSPLPENDPTPWSCR